MEHALEVFLPLPVLGELRAGFSVGGRGAENERTLGRFLRRPGVAVLVADETTTHHLASVFRQLRGQGKPIPTNDMWIAALVLQHDVILHARDRHFDSLPQLRRI